MKKIMLLIPVLLILFSVLAPVTTFAQVKLDAEKYVKDIDIPMKDLIDVKNDKDTRPAGTKAANWLLQKVADGLIYIAAPIAVLFVVHAGVSYTIAFGDTTKTDAAKKELLWAVLGLIVIILAIIMIRMFIAFFFMAAPAATTTPAAPAATATPATQTQPTGNGGGSSHEPLPPQPGTPGGGHTGPI